MRIEVNGVRLWFDVEGAALQASEESLERKPTLILLHGGPGADHSVFKPLYSQLASVAQIIYLDHRANGRSEHGPRSHWTLEQWGKDIKSFCDALEIQKPGAGAFFRWHGSAIIRHTVSGSPRRSDFTVHCLCNGF